MKVEEPSFEFEAIEFCQCHPVFNGEQFSMCRNVHKALFTDVSHIGRTVDEIKAIRSATSQCGLVWSKGFPIFGPFYESLHIDCTGKPLMHSGTFYNSLGCTTGTVDVTDEARLSFERAFGISPQEQVAIEAFYSSLNHEALDDPTLILEYNPSFPASHYPIHYSESLSVLLNIE